jgi:capsular exopolysaccharide synthesis family protein
VLILVTTLVFGAVAYFVSDRQTPSYSAESAVRYLEPQEDTGVFSTSVGTQKTPEERAAAGAEVIRGRAMAERVRKKLHLRRVPHASASVEAQTSFVVITTRDSDPEHAAEVADGYARVTRDLATEDERDRLSRAAKTLRKRYRENNIGTSRESRAGLLERLARLEAAADYTKPVEIVRRASVPTTAVSPKPGRNAVLGAVLGLTLGILAAFVRDSLDRRFRRPDEIQDQLGLPVVGQVSRSAMGRLPVAANGTKPLSELDIEAIRILRRNIDFLDASAPFRSIAVTSGYQEEGKSTVAASLATATVSFGKRTALVECDLRRPVLAKWFGIEPAPGLSDYLAGRAEPQEVLREIVLEEAGHIGNGSGPTPSHPLVCIPAGSHSGRPAESLASDRFREFLAEISDVYDVVILDTSPMLPVVDTLEILPHVDAILLCVRARQTTREQARVARAALERMPERPTGVVVTGLRPQDQEADVYYSYGTTAD